jgi:hypothetical protein
MRPPILRAAVVVATLLGCGGETDHVAVVRTGVEAVPASRGELRVESERPLSFGVILSLDSATLLAADRVTNDVWLIDASGSEVQMRHVLSGEDRMRARLVAITASETEWRLLDRAGGVHRFHRDSWQLSGTSRVSFGAGIIVAAASDGEGGFALIVRRPSSQGPSSSEYALLLLASDGSVRETWRSTEPLAARSAGADRLSLAPAADGWLLAGTEPPRTLHFDGSGALQQERPILTTPGRKLSREVIAHFDRAAAAAGLAGSLRAPTHYPPITALRQAGPAYLAVPYVGGPTGEAQGLDVYCDDRYSHTVLDSPDIVQVLLSDHAVIVVSETGELSYTIDVYRLNDLPVTCEAAP